jgi:hypothetical protein
MFINAFLNIEVTKCVKMSFMHSNINCSFDEEKAWRESLILPQSKVFTVNKLFKAISGIKTDKNANLIKMKKQDKLHGTWIENH